MKHDKNRQFWLSYLRDNPTLKLIIKNGAVYETFPNKKLLHSFGSSIEAVNILLDSGYSEKSYLLEIRD